MEMTEEPEPEPEPEPPRTPSSTTSAYPTDPTTSPSTTTTSTNTNILPRLYLSHTLSTWNARTFEFAAVLFLASAFPGTLLYASAYALVRAAAAAALAGWVVGGVVDGADRLVAVRASVVAARGAVAGSCGVFAVMGSQGGKVGMWWWFAGAVVLACVERLAVVGNTVAVERDWVGFLFFFFLFLFSLSCLKRELLGHARWMWERESVLG